VTAAASWASDVALPAEPACWSWPIGMEALDRAEAEYLEPARAGGLLRILLWQDGRCAVCGHRRADLVTDHDHRTGLARGFLCRSCNSFEGHDRSGGGVFQAYRQRNPASMLEVTTPYWDPILGEPRAPQAGAFASVVPLQNSTDTGPSKNTRRVYARFSGEFRTWCAEQSPSACPLPATPQTLAWYAEHLIRRELAPRSIELAITAIRSEHESAGYPRPDRRPVDALLTGYAQDRAARGVRSSKRASITGGQLQQLLAASSAGVVGVRDRALIGLCWSTKTLRSELVGLDLVDVTETGAGLEVRISTGRKPRVVPVPLAEDAAECPVRLVRSWRAELADRGIVEGPLFRAVDRHGNVAGEVAHAGRSSSGLRMSGSGVAKILQRAAQAAGLEENISPHSLRGSVCDGEGLGCGKRGDVGADGGVGRHAGGGCWACGGGVDDGSGVAAQPAAASA
jgi:site-specific recombinase XerD